MYLRINLYKQNICENFKAKIGGINEREIRAWDNSMQYMYRVLSDHEIPNNTGIAIEFKIPHTSKIETEATQVSVFFVLRHNLTKFLVSIS
jgi:hypothetical protein